MILKLLLLLISIAIVGCAPQSESGEVQEVSIAYLKSLCRGSHYRIASDYKISGIVVATDWLGELHNSFLLVDETAGVEVALEADNIAEQLPIYSRVEILCSGLMLARVGGKIELGAPATGSFLLDNIAGDMIDRTIRVVGTSSYSIPTKSIKELSVEDIGGVARFDDVEVCESERGLAWCDKVENEAVTTFRTIVDAEGNALYIRTLSTCHYALEDMPTKKFSVAGIVDYADDRYFLRIINHAII